MKQNNKIVSIILCIVIGTSLLLGGYAVGKTQVLQTSFDREQVIEKGKAAITACFEKEQNAYDILQISYAPTEEESFLLSTGNDDLLEETMNRRGYVVMYADWRMRWQERSYRRYFLISNHKDKAIVESSASIPLADGSMNITRDMEECAIAEAALRQMLIDSNPDIVIQSCQISTQETVETIQQVAATRQALLYGWTKEFLENRFLVVCVTAQFSGGEDTEEPQNTQRMYILIQELSTNQWDIWDWYNPEEEAIFR